jgi:C4-type Zn-finger protein
MQTLILSPKTVTNGTFFAKKIWNNPVIVSYNASEVKFYNATSNLHKYVVSCENKKNVYALVVNSQVVSISSGAFL